MIYVGSPVRVCRILCTIRGHSTQLGFIQIGSGVIQTDPGSFKKEAPGSFKLSKSDPVPFRLRSGVIQIQLGFIQNRIRGHSTGSGVIQLCSGSFKTCRGHSNSARGHSKPAGVIQTQLGVIQIQLGVIQNLSGSFKLNSGSFKPVGVIQTQAGVIQTQVGVIQTKLCSRHL